FSHRSGSVEVASVYSTVLPPGRIWGEFTFSVALSVAMVSGRPPFADTRAMTPGTAHTMPSSVQLIPPKKPTTSMATRGTGDPPDIGIRLIVPSAVRNATD